MSSLMARLPDELLTRCAGCLDTPSAGRLTQVSRAGERLTLARLAAEKAERAAQAAAVVAAQAAPRQHAALTAADEAFIDTFAHMWKAALKLPPLAEESLGDASCPRSRLV